jgi:hypothetical protein
MPWSRIFWILLAIGILLLTIAPLASYCLGRDEDYRDKGELTAPAPPSRQSAVVIGPLIR